MRIDILAIGSRGDVQPYVALGLGIQKAGHRVRIITLGGFEELVRGFGLDHVAIGDRPQEIANTAAGRKWVADRSSTFGYLRGFVHVVRSLIEEGISSYWHTCRDAEALIVSPMGVLVGGHIAERLCVPLIQAPYVPPVLPTRYDWDGRRNVVTALQGGLRAFQHAAFHFLLWSKLRHSTNAARRKILGLPPLPLTEPFNAIYRKRLPLLCGYSPAVVPRVPDWGDWIHVTGYWFLDDSQEWVPPGDLVDFLGSGPPPVFVGFGSTPFPQPELTTGLVVRALQKAGQRGLLIAGGSGLETGRLTDEVFSVDFVPHGWLFPQVCAAVHHGGAGVTGAALRAGLPSVVVPVFADQPFWGSRVFKLGASPHPIPAKHLTEHNLASAIRATLSKEMRSRAAALGKQIRAEDGVGRAVEIIHKYVGKGALNALRHQHAD
jgi:sterol 3beta-glucosyltransferase